MDLLKCGFDCYHEVLKDTKTIYGIGRCTYE